jgi:hypothetical protein
MTFFVKFAGSGVKSEENVFSGFVACLGDGFEDELDCFFV